MNIFYLIILIVNILSTFSLGFFTYLKNKDLKHFLAFNLAITFYSSFQLLWVVSNNYKTVLMASYIVMAGITLLPYTYSIFCHELAKIKPKFIPNLLNLLFLFIFIILSFTPLIIKDVKPILSFTFWPRAGLLFPLYLGYFVINVFWGHYILLKYLVRDKRIIYILIGTFLGFLGGATNFFLFYSIAVPPVANILISVYMPLVSYAIVKHDLLDISVVIKRSVATAIIFFLIIASFSIAFLTLNFNNKALVLALTLLGLFWAFATYPTVRFLITTRARKFLKGWYAPEDVLNSISNKVEKEKSKRKIFTIIGKEIFSSLESENITLLVARKNNTQKVTHYLVLDLGLHELGQIDLPNVVFEYLIKVPEIINYKKLITKITKDLKSEILETDLTKFSEFIPLLGNRSYLLPFNSPEILEGIIVVNEKSEGKPFKDKDLTLFNLIVKQINNLLYKLTPYEKIEQEFQKNKEKLYEAQVQLVRAEKITGLARIIQNSNHEIRTPIHIINMAATNISKEVHPEVEEIQRFIHTVTSQTARALSVIENSLDLAANKSISKNKLNLNTIIEESLKLLSKDYPKINTNLQQIPDIMGIKSDLISVVINLINNAKKAMDKNGEISITTNYQKDLKQIILEISDTGCGIPPENLEKIWEPYFTTDATYGHGLGLSIVHQIIQNHNAQIQVESQINKGTTFIIKFPMFA